MTGDNISPSILFSVFNYKSVSEPSPRFCPDVFPHLHTPVSSGVIGSQNMSNLLILNEESPSSRQDLRQAFLSPLPLFSSLMEIATHGPLLVFKMAHS